MFDLIFESLKNNYKCAELIMKWFWDVRFFKVELILSLKLILLKIKIKICNF